MRSLGAAIARRRSSPRGIEPLSPQRKWRAITIATLVLVPAFWALLAGLVAVGSDDPAGPNPGASIAFGLALIPFVFIALAFLSEHLNPAAAVLKAMGWFLLIGIPVSALAGDAVTGIVAGVGAGGISALRADDAHNRRARARARARALAVVAASVYTLVLVRTVGAFALLPAPVFPFTGIGVADHLSERRREREAVSTRVR
jgi:MFS family permease